MTSLCTNALAETTISCALQRASKPSTTRTRAISTRPLLCRPWGWASSSGGDGVRTRGSAVRVLVLLSMVAGTVVGLAVPAQATFHFVRVRQVFAGLPGHHNVQYIELQSFQVCCQNMFEGHHVDVFDAAGKRVG